MYNINEAVVYGASGVCRVTDIRLEDFGAGRAKYYVLTPMSLGSSTIYVPVESENLCAKIMKVLSKAEIYDILGDVSNEQPIWYDNERERAERFRKILDSGDRKSIVMIIHSLVNLRRKLNDNGKQLHISDDKILKSAEKIISYEFGYVLGISPDDVSDFVTTELSRAKNAG